MSKCASQCSKSIQTPLPPTFLHLLHLFHLSKPDELYDLHLKGPSIKYVTLFLANFYPSPPPCHTSSHIPGPPESTSHISDPRFLEGLVQKNGQKSPCSKPSSQKTSCQNHPYKKPREEFRENLYRGLSSGLLY